jgi:hypothetical protein
MKSNYNEEYENNTDGDPFGEEFDKDDVVNTKIFVGDDSDPDNQLPDVDVDSILNYDEEKRKTDYFKNQFFSENEDIADDVILQKNFRDFLVVKKITGRFEGIGSDSRIPSERIVDSGKKIEISDDPNHEVKSEKKTTVAVHRDEAGEISFIEVICSCGEKTTIALDFGEDNAFGDEDTDLIESEGVPDIGLNENFIDLGIEKEIDEDKSDYNKQQ